MTGVESVEAGRDTEPDVESAPDHASGWVLDVTVDEFDPPDLSHAARASDRVAEAWVPSVAEQSTSLAAALDDIFGPEPDPEPAPVPAAPVRRGPATERVGNGRGAALAHTSPATTGWSFDGGSDAQPSQAIDWEHVHMAMPRLLGQAAYTPPRRFFIPSERPFDPDDLPLQAARPDDDAHSGVDAATEAELARARAGAGPGFRLAPETLRSLGSIFRRGQ